MDRPEATSRTGRLGAWAWLGAAALAAILLAGCGSIPASSTGVTTGASPAASPSPSVSPGAAATQTALCLHTQTVSSLVITRNHLLRVPQLQANFPNQVAVTPVHARAVARALCGLPSLPHGVFNCPNLTAGSTYLLRFTGEGRQLPTVSIEATGCEAVYGVGAPRWAAKSPGFWRTLATAANLSPPGRGAFTGAGGRVSCEPLSSRPAQANDCPARSKPDSGAVS